MAPDGSAATTRVWGGLARPGEPAEVFRTQRRVELRDAVAEVYEVPQDERSAQGLARLAAWKRGVLPPNSKPVPLPVQAESPPHRRDPGPPHLVKGLAMRSHWQQALREFLAHDEQLSGHVLLSAHKFVKGGGINLNFALSTLTDMSWSVMVSMWEAWQDGRLSTVFDVEQIEGSYRMRYHELVQQFMECRAQWLEELSDFRDQRRKRVWDASKQASYEAAFEHDVFEFIPEAALAEEHRPYFKKALEECVKLALTAGADEKVRSLLDRISRLEAELAKALAEIERLREEEREREEQKKELYKKPLRPTLTSAAPPEEVVPPSCKEKESQTDFDDPPPKVVTKEPDSDDAWRLQAEQDKNAYLEKENKRLEALLKERDEELEALRRGVKDLELALGNQQGNASRLSQLERDKADLLEKLKQLKQLLEAAEARSEDLLAQLEEANSRVPAPVKERRKPTKPAGVQTVEAPVAPPTPAPAPAPRRPALVETGAQTEPLEQAPGTVTMVQAEPPPRRRMEDLGVQAELGPEPPPSDDELQRRLAELQRQLREEREGREALERATRELESQLQAERDRFQSLEKELRRQIDAGAAGSERTLSELRSKLERALGERDEARRLLELERERSRTLEEALQALRLQLEDLKKRLQALGADVSKVDEALNDEILQGVTRPRVFDRLWDDAKQKIRKKKEKEEEAHIYSSAADDAILKLRNPNMVGISAGDWLFTDADYDATCPCCGRPCISSTLAAGTWLASDGSEVPTSVPFGELRQAEVRPARARQKSPVSHSANVSSGARSATPLSHSAHFSSGATLAGTAGTWQASKDFVAPFAAPGTELRHAEVRPAQARQKSPLSHSANVSSGARSGTPLSNSAPPSRGTVQSGDGLGGARAGQLQVDDLPSGTLHGRSLTPDRGRSTAEPAEEGVAKSLSTAFDEVGLGHARRSELGQAHGPELGQAHGPELGQAHRSELDQAHRSELGQAHGSELAVSGRRSAHDAASRLGLALDARRSPQAADETPQAEEAGKRARAGAPAPLSAVEARAASLSGSGMSFSEHCRRLGDGVAQDPEESPDVTVKMQSKSLELSHLLLGHPRRPNLPQDGGADAENQMPPLPRTPDGGGGVPVAPGAQLMRSMVPSIRPSTSSSATSLPPSIRPSTSSAHARRSAPLLPLGSEAAAAAQRARLALKEEPSHSAAGGAAADGPAPPRPLPRRWSERSGGSLQRTPPSASQPKLDRCCMRACGNLPTAPPRR